MSVPTRVDIVLQIVERSIAVNLFLKLASNFSTWRGHEFIDA
jgi:hypothetical protein